MLLLQIGVTSEILELVTRERAHLAVVDSRHRGASASIGYYVTKLYFRNTYSFTYSLLCSDHRDSHIEYLHYFLLRRHFSTSSTQGLF